MKKNFLSYFSKGELALWLSSVIVTVVSHFMSPSGGTLSLAASLIGVTALIFNAKGNPTGPALMVIFALLYGYISFGFAYYGEMLTYVCMSMPMAVFSFVSWLKNPYKGNKAEVTVNFNVSKAEYAVMCILTVLVTAVFYLILKYLNTANLIWSTVSVTTSFVAVYLSAKRSPFFAIGYAANDVVLIVLWSLAAMHDISYLSVVICFAAFLANDLYSFVNWQRIGKRQMA